MLSPYEVEGDCPLTPTDTCAPVPRTQIHSPTQKKMVFKRGVGVTCSFLLFRTPVYTRGCLGVRRLGRSWDILDKCSVAEPPEPDPYWETICSQKLSGLRCAPRPSGDDWRTDGYH